ncbi:probable thiol methyltransferase 2 isoform X1 [Miscanthus floridulus]|uniref:probable thiol methyltransferase 2 isoform X1 n=1 Tax=Miscanthus floridulus TaxID=154761 RepID=UPI0034576D7C
MAMASTAIAGGGQVLNVSNPAVVRVRQLIGGTAEYSSDGWRRCWEEGVTPWDLGQPTPAVVDLVNSGTLPGGDHDGRATTVLVPGCGAGHDVVALSGAGRFVVGLDISEAAIHKARQRAAAADGNSFDFVAADFFTWEPPDKFDIIFDYTFFCAFEPSMRPAWAKRIADLLKQDGELITLMYLAEGQEAGPPFNTAVVDYEEVLNPLGLVMNSIQDNEVAVQSRKGMEKMARWKRMANPTSLNSAGETQTSP